MASNKLPLGKLWRTLWNIIPDPLSDGCLLVALDDFTNPKTGRKIFGCSYVFDQAAEMIIQLAIHFVGVDITHASTYRGFLYGKYRDVKAFSRTVMLKTLKCPAKVVWVFWKNTVGYLLPIVSSVFVIK